jgi:hypothetical protein
MCKEDEILFDISTSYFLNDMKPFCQGTIPLMRIASSGQTSSHLRQPKQTSSLIISSRPLLSFKQRTGQISTQAPQALQ